MKHLTTWLGDNVWMLAAVIGGQGFKRNHTNLAGTEEVASDGRSGRSEEKWLNGASRPPSNAQRENRVAVNFAVIHCKLRCHATGEVMGNRGTRVWEIMGDGGGSLRNRRNLHFGVQIRMDSSSVSARIPKRPMTPESVTQAREKSWDFVGRDFFTTALPYLVVKGFRIPTYS
ncbi:MAG: hypothetical protein ABGX15_00995 [Paracoccaceae bacterium]